MIVYLRESKENDISWKGDGSRRIPRIITVDSTKNFWLEQRASATTLGLIICLCCLLMFLFCVIIILRRQMVGTFILNANGSLIIYGMYRYYCPKKTIILSLKKLLKPWITDNIRRMVNFKHQLFKQYKNRIIAFETYNNYTYNLQRIMEKAKRDYFVRRLNNNCENNIKKTCKIVNSLLSKPYKKCTTLLDSSGAEVHDSRDIANNVLWPLFHYSRQTGKWRSEDR